MSRWTVDFTTSVQVLYSAQLGWTGRTHSKHFLSSRAAYLLILERIKEKLRSGDLIIPGDQWPTFLYAGNFDREDPWKGLFKNAILISVSGFLTTQKMDFRFTFVYIGFQARVYVTKLSGQREQGNAIGKHPNSRYDTSHLSSNCIYHYSGAGYWLP